MVIETVALVLFEPLFLSYRSLVMFDVCIEYLFRVYRARISLGTSALKPLAVSEI